MSSQIIDLTGKRYGRLVVLGLDRKENYTAYWLCKCDCGSNAVVARRELQTGDTKSCGCLQKEEARQRLTTHGKSKTPTHTAWRGMIGRCRYSKHKSFPDYGGRGIKVCDRWKAFSAFLADMGERPLGTTIERIDSNGNYEPKNCRWVARKVQNNNRRSNRLVTFNGETLTVAEWADRLGLNYHTLYNRLFTIKWTIEKSFTTPLTP